MGLSSEIKNEIEHVIQKSLRDKFENYKPETSFMPFHERLLGKDRLALHSFIHSLHTNFGSTIFEPVAVALARNNFVDAKSHISTGHQISEGALFEIQRIMNDLETASILPDKIQDIETIRKVCQEGKTREFKPTIVDLWLESQTGELLLFEIKTAKPNAGGVREFKRTLLEWVAAILFTNPNAKVTTYLAMPYNPYEPKPYARFTLRGMLDIKRELMVAGEFWDFLGGEGTYQDLLDCFEKVGIELREEIDKYFERFKKR